MDEEAAYIKNNQGSVLGKQKTGEAKKGFKVEATFNRKIDKKKEIFEETDLKTEIPRDERVCPEHDAIFRQQVGTEDVYLGMSGKDVSSNSCDEMLLRVKLPGTVLKEIGLETKEQSIHVQTGKYLLNYSAPYPIIKNSGNAKWVSDKEELEVRVFS